MSVNDYNKCLIINLKKILPELTSKKLKKNLIGLLYIQ